ncbi:hypothetical protein ASPZODRAFT_150792 [Penicilliopsis zonata CBS 506.65]|uniref:C2H2-type domain-containing protein n=1 Tax=Penicilliopsis zonata CBS 506.65 TaxID=1073090 RepID=A0A1L9SNH9_9EURO|nr:hypothetical protein ASPZODRAFT_150792 [Penicilliopsis zonata CBS 506.65]OJJ48597.1 hypothetical protein ASPZODRAFT_150792 [Penicilliopsis zonata CBS 506.65]
MPKEHICPEPGCGKSFLRPEHLSRHCLNHRPKQIYHCSSCPKRFVRKDLLRRHEKRHEKGMWFRNSGGMVVVGIAGESVQFSRHHGHYQGEESSTATMTRKTAIYSVDDDDNVGRQHQDEPAENSENEPRSQHMHREGSVDKQQPVRLPEAAAVARRPDVEEELYGTMTAAVVTGGGGGGTRNNVTSLFFDSACLPDSLRDFEWLFDNVSADFGAASEGASNINNSNTSGISRERSMSTTTVDLSPSSFSMQTSQIRSPPLMDSSSYFAPWVTVQGRLLEALRILPPEILVSSFFYPANLARFFELYFENYHHHFPILHKPTLDPTKAPPLLITAIITLGSTLSSDAGHFEMATKIHDSLRYIVFNTADFEPPASLWCIQTLLLIQAHENLFSTRKHSQLAHIFHGAIITLMKRGVSYSNREVTNLEDSWYQWIESQSCNRTAFFGFIMDAQQSFMFGLPCILSVQDLRLPLPCHDSLWESGNAEEWSCMMRKTSESPGFLPVLKMLLARNPIPPRCSAYARLILLHGLFSVTASLKARDSVSLRVSRMPVGRPPVHNPPSETWMWGDKMERAMDTWAFCLVSRSSSLALEASKPLHRMAYVAIYTDITDMHVLAGTPSLPGSFLSEADVAGATTRVRAWSKKPEARRALYHCLLLIQEVLFTGTHYRASYDSISLRPWSLYRATLVLWAYGYMYSFSPSSSSREIRLPDRPVPYSAEEYLIRMLMLLRNETEDISSVATQTEQLLQAVRESLEGCRWELLQEAYDTLGRLMNSSI